MSSFVIQPIVQVVGIIIVGGLFGGVTAYTVSVKAFDPNDSKLKPPAIEEYLLLGVVAAACVPLFLSLLKSGLLAEIFTITAADGKTARPPAFESYLIFIGLCLIAAFSARKFIDTVTTQVFQRMEKMEERVEHVDARVENVGAQVVEAKADASQAVETAEAAKEVASETAEEAENADNVAPAPADVQRAKALAPKAREAIPSLSLEERKILEAMTKKVYRTRSGIVEDSGVSRNRISEMLEDLAERKLALPTKSPRTGGQRWIITERGRAALRLQP